MATAKTKITGNPVNGSKLIRELLSDCHEADATSIVAHFMGKVDLSDQQAVADLLEAMMPSWLFRNAWGRNGQGGRSPITSALPNPAPKPSSGTSVRRHKKPAVNPSRLAGIAPLYAQILDRREQNADGKQIFMRDMTMVDMLAAAERRSKQAGRIEASAEQFRKVASRMEADGVSTVADLDSEFVMEALR